MSEIDGYYAGGFLGQFLVIVPKSKTVAVRRVNQSKDYNSRTDGFDEFISLVMHFGKQIVWINAPPNDSMDVRAKKRLSSTLFLQFNLSVPILARGALSLNRQHSFATPPRL